MKNYMILNLCACLAAAGIGVHAEAEPIEPAPGATAEIHLVLEDAALAQINANWNDNEDDPNSYRNLRYPLSSVTVSENGVTETLTGMEMSIKGRGNSTWFQEKKPYQIAFSEKVNLFGMGKAKKWVLLANYLDPSMVRTQLAFDCGNVLNHNGPFSCQGQFVELYVQDAGRKTEDYIGLYYLTHRIAIGKTELNLNDPDGILMELNQPSHYDNGIEDMPVESALYHSRFTLKDCEGEAQQAEDSFMELYNRFEEALAQRDWEEISACIDMDSFASYYLLSEFTADSDTSVSSFFMYRDGENDIIHAGPYWDYDSTMGSFVYDEVVFDSPGRLWANKGRVTEGRRFEVFEVLFEFPQFRTLVSRAWKELSAALPGILLKLEATCRTIRTAADRDHRRYKLPAFRDSVNELTRWVLRRTGLMDRIFLNETVFEDGLYRIGDSAVILERQADGAYVLTDVEGGGTWTGLPDHSFPNTTNAGDPAYDADNLVTYGLLKKQEYTGGRNQQWMFFKNGGRYVLMNLENDLFCCAEGLRTLDHLNASGLQVADLSLRTYRLSRRDLYFSSAAQPSVFVGNGLYSAACLDETVAKAERNYVTPIGGGRTLLFAKMADGCDWIPVIVDGWKHAEADYWYELGFRQGIAGDPKNIFDGLYGLERGREIYDPESDAWYWLDCVYDGAKAVNKEVWMPYLFQNDLVYGLNKTGKWVRYDAEGRMVKGWFTVSEEYAEIYPEQAGNTYYYDLMTGQMYKGDHMIDGVLYHFDRRNGVLLTD